MGSFLTNNSTIGKAPVIMEPRAKLCSVIAFPVKILFSLKSRAKKFMKGILLFHSNILFTMIL